MRLDRNVNGCEGVSWTKVRFFWYLVHFDGQVTLYQGEFAGGDTFMTHAHALVAILPTGLAFNSLKFFEVIFNGPNQSRSTTLDFLPLLCTVCLMAGCKVDREGDRVASDAAV